MLPKVDLKPKKSAYYTASNNRSCVTYEQYDLGAKWKVFQAKHIDYDDGTDGYIWEFAGSFETIGKATEYAKKIERGGC